MEVCTRCKQTVLDVTPITSHSWSHDWEGDLCDDCYKEFQKFMDGSSVV
ncbi:MAG: hypothetical protein AMQ22_00615 [Candidatus Methanofastidiosum methylothiophilum]|uniref:Uncharacterized protein n=1 Tax=Candidatus Methanofastidiosum methylothiophilum TaxID=1705564 RepID=A0A150J789_9EURY|nr:MAG: hypothetical protein AMQ22_00615 [Candidatus Methanofastidiosum methylthiophilus]